MTDTNQPTPPLWRVMHTAHMEHADPFAVAVRKAYAAEIRAIADVVLPEELEALCGSGEPWPETDQARSSAKWEQRMALRQRFLDEADRAEQGEG